MIQGSRKPNGDALTMKIDGCDANGQGLADAKERVGIDGTGGGGVGTPHGGDVEKSVATDAEVEENDPMVGTEDNDAEATTEDNGVKVVMVAKNNNGNVSGGECGLKRGRRGLF